MLGLIRTTDWAQLVWGPECGHDAEEWIPADGAPASATVVTIRPLSSLDLVSAQSAGTPEDPGHWAKFWASHIRAAFVSVKEGGKTMTDPDALLALPAHVLTPVMLAQLGRAILDASAGPTDPT